MDGSCINTNKWNTDDNRDRLTNSDRKVRSPLFGCGEVGNYNNRIICVQLHLYKNNCQI